MGHLSEDEVAAAASVGVGPHALPWPEDPRFDPDLLEHGDRRNVGDEYRYWSVEAIKADLDRTRNRLHVAIRTLRVMGLERVLLSDEDGYHLDPKVAFTFVSEP